MHSNYHLFVMFAVFFSVAVNIIGGGLRSVQGFPKYSK